MAKLPTLFLCLIVLNAALALKCKRCKGIKDNEDCHEMDDEACQGPGSGQEPACLTMIYKTADQKEQVEKRCVLKSKDKNFECVWPPNTTHGDLKTACQTCTEDGCNEKAGKGGAASLQGVGTLMVGVVTAVLFFPRLM